MMAQVDGAQVDGAQVDGAQVDGAQVDGAQVDGAQVSDCTNVALEQPLKVGTMEKWLREFSEGQHRTPYISRSSRPHPSSRCPTDFAREPFLYSSESEEEDGDEMIFASELIKISNEFKAIREENANLISDNAKLKSSNAKFHADQQKEN
jgi:post-segregation antitoxin (ccd killing protein)